MARNKFAYLLTYFSRREADLKLCLNISTWVTATQVSVAVVVVLYKQLLNTGGTRKCGGKKQTCFMLPGCSSFPGLPLRRPLLPEMEKVSGEIYAITSL
jgi:hypothetical protein